MPPLFVAGLFPLLLQNKPKPIMISDFQKELLRTFSNTERIIEDKFKFNRKLDIGDKVYTKLRSANFALNLFLSIMVGIVAAVIAAKLGSSPEESWGIWKFKFETKEAIQAPIEMVVIIGIIVFFATYQIIKLFNKYSDSALYKIPKFLNTELDLLALHVASLIISPIVKIADMKNFGETEEKKIVDNFFVEWGYNPIFIVELLRGIKTNIGKPSPDDMLKQFNDSCNSIQELQYKVLEENMYTLAETVFNENTTESNENIQKLRNLFSKN
jgi:hypothetical protein